MSDNWLQLVPYDPEYQPSIDVAEKARSLFESFVPDAEKVIFSIKDSTEFFHPMANWSGVECPICGADLESWWGLEMQERSTSNYQNLVVTSPCCGSPVSLNELRYRWPAGFGRFVLEAMNPNIRDLTPSQENALSQSACCSLRKIWVHI